MVNVIYSIYNCSLLTTHNNDSGVFVIWFCVGGHAYVLNWCMCVCACATE